MREFRFPKRALWTAGIIGAVFLIGGALLFNNSLHLVSDTGEMVGFFLIPFGLVFSVACYLRSRYAVFITEERLIVHEPPLRDVVLDWKSIVEVVETKKRNLQYYDLHGRAGKVFCEVENVHVIVAETRRHLQPKVYERAENLMRQIEFKQELRKSAHS